MLLYLLILVTCLEKLIYICFEFQLIYEFERILGVDNIKEKYQKNLFSVASAIIEVAKEMKARNSKEELAKILLLLVGDSDMEEAEPSQGDYQ